MKLKKGLIAALCLLLCFTVVGCGGKISGKNTDKSFRIVSIWEKSGIGSHYNSGTNIGPLQYFSVEGLYQYVRSTDEIFPVLAKELPVHSEDGLKTTVTLRDNAYWHNGEKVIAKDIWAFYYLNHTVVTNYLLSVEAKDETTLVFNWNPARVPVNDVKNLLIAQDMQGVVCYNEFRVYAETAAKIVNDSEDIPADSTMWGAFNKFSKGELLAQLNANFNAYKTHKTSWFVGTGPFKLTKESPTQLILTKNAQHWNAEKIGFEKIEVYSSSDTNQTYGLLSNDKIDYMDGLAPIDTLESILKQNQSMAHVKMYDPGSIGVLFNLEKPIWTKGVREAFQYLFDREEMKNVGNPYGVTSYYPLLGMAESEAQTWMTEEGLNALPKYSYNTAKAEELLLAEGWKKTDGKWYDSNNKLVDLTIGTVKDHPGQSATASAVQSGLQSFGIKSSIKMTDWSAWYANASMKNSTYDLSVYWTDLNMSFSYPTGSYKYFDSLMGNVIHVPRFPENYEVPELMNAINVEFDGLDSKFADANGKVNFSTYLNTMYVYDQQDIKELVDIYNRGIANANWGIQFYQNVTGSFINKDRLTGVPMQEQWSQSRNVTIVPEAGTEDFFAVARTNLIYANGTVITQGIYQPNV